MKVGEEESWRGGFNKALREYTGISLLAVESQGERAGRRQMSAMGARSCL